MSTDDPRGPAEPYRPPAPSGSEPEPTGPVRVPPAPSRPEPQRPEPIEPARMPPTAPPAPERATPPERAAAPAAQHRPPTDLDEFLARAVDRQIAEQRALREALQELTNAVRELQARPTQAAAPAGPAFDPAEIEARIARGETPR